MKTILLLATVLAGSACTFHVKHKWENGLTCKCKGSMLAQEATCVCEPNDPKKCEPVPQPVAQKGNSK